MAERRRLSGTQVALLIGAVAAVLIFMPHRCTHDIDEQHYPYAMTGIRASVLWGGGEFKDLNDISATYDQRVSGVSQCQAEAKDFATEKQLESWSYVCCTITPDSSCKTKVK
jgi:hypothetical protein